MREAGEANIVVSTDCLRFGLEGRGEGGSGNGTEVTREMKEKEEKGAMAALELHCSTPPLVMDTRSPLSTLSFSEGEHFLYPSGSHEPLARGSLKPKKRKKKTQQHPGYHPRRVRLLLADDVPLNRTMFERMAQTSFRKMLGLRVTVDMVEDGKKALELWRQEGDQAWDMIFLDHDMPVMNGKECTERMRAEGGALPIVGVTARVDKDEEWFVAGLTEIMHKPFNRYQLIDIVRRHLGSRRLGEEVEGPAYTI